MVAGDRDVQQAVEDALAAPGEASSAIPGSEPTWSEPLPTAQTTVPPSVAHREEDPVELQDWTPSSTSFDPPAATPGWGIAEPAAPSVSSREEAIAEVLRAAINEGRSEESLTGILRRVMDGASPADALAETPFEPQVEVPPAVTAAVSATVSEAATIPEIAQAVVSEPVVVAEPVVETPIVEVAAEVEVFAAEPVDEAPAAVEEWPASALLSPDTELGWDPISSSLWADFIPTERMSTQSGDASEPEVEAQIEPEAVSRRSRSRSSQRSSRRSRPPSRRPRSRTPRSPRPSSRRL